MQKKNKQRVGEIICAEC